MQLFEGSIGRLKFLGFILAWNLVATLAVYLTSNVNSRFEIIDVVLGIVAIPLLFWAIIKRLHDIGLSGWYSLIVIVPLFAIPLLLALMVWPGKPGKVAK